MDSAKWPSYTPSSSFSFEEPTPQTATSNPEGTENWPLGGSPPLYISQTSLMDFRKAALYHQPNGTWSSTWSWREGSRAFHISLPTGAGHNHLDKQKRYSQLTACQKGTMSYHSNRYCLDGWMNQQKIRERGFQSVITTISLDKQWRHNPSWGYGNVLLPSLQPLLNSGTTGLNATNPLTLDRRDTPGMYVAWPLFMCLKHAKLSSYIF